jgi:hypothetical protein
MKICLCLALRYPPAVAAMNYERFETLELILSAFIEMGRSFFKLNHVKLPTEPVQRKRGNVIQFALPFRV